MAVQACLRLGHENGCHGDLFTETAASGLWPGLGFITSVQNLPLVVAIPVTAAVGVAGVGRLCRVRCFAISFSTPTKTTTFKWPMFGGHPRGTAGARRVQAARQSP